MSEPKRLEAHLFVCTNVKEKGRCCGKSGGLELRARVKELAGDPARGWKGRMRVNASGCLGRCEEGGVAVLYPQGEWFTGLGEESAPVLLDALARALDRDGK